VSFFEIVGNPDIMNKLAVDFGCQNNNYVPQSVSKTIKKGNQMVFTCSNPKCNHDHFNFIAFNFNVPNNQARSAFALECSKCKNIQDIIRITPIQIPRQDPNQVKTHRDSIDSIGYKDLYEKLSAELAKLNLKIVKKNGLGDIALEPVDSNKLTGLIDSNLQLQAKNSTTGLT